MCFNQKNVYSYFWNKLHKVDRKWFKKRAFPLEPQQGTLDYYLQCATTDRQCKNSWTWLEEIKHWSLVRQRPLIFLQNHPIRSMHSHNSSSTCCCSPLVRIDVLKHLDASLSEFKPLSQIRTPHGSLLIASSDSPAFSTALDSDFKIAERELTIMKVPKRILVHLQQRT